MITKLTIEQEQKIKEYYDFYLAKGLSTKPANRLVAENAVKELYKLIKEKEPKCLWVNSPIELIALFKKSNLESNLWGNLWGNLESNLESNLWGNLESNLCGNLESNLWGNLESNLRNNLRSNLESNLWGNLESNLWGNLESNLWGNLWGNLRRGQLNSPWISFYDYYRTVVTNTFSAEDNHRLDLYIDLLDCSYFITLRNFVILIDHPLAFHVDGQGKTHNHLNHAIKFRDDTGIYVIHGQQLNETEFNDKKKLLEQKKITNLEYLEMESVA
ncbi:MAG: hypothetical protein ACREBR_05470 [bacterium]